MFRKVGGHKRKEGSAGRGTCGRTLWRAGEVLFCFLRRKLEHDLLTGRNELVEGEGLDLIIRECVCVCN